MSFALKNKTQRLHAKDSSSVVLRAQKNTRRQSTTRNNNNDGGPTISCSSFRSLQIPTGVNVKLSIAPSNTICTLTIKNLNDESYSIPVGRSYDNNPWEAVAGPFKHFTYECDNTSSSCQVQIPEILSSQAEDRDDESLFFVLENLETRTLSEKNEAARFFEQATFGVTKDDLNQVENRDQGTDLASYFVQWTYDQMYNQPLTSHRSFWRRRTLMRYDTAGREGRATRPCEEGSYWRGFAFIETDKDKDLEIHIMDGKFSFSIDGQFRSMVDTFELQGATPDFDTFPKSYKICRATPYIGGAVLVFAKDKCRHLIGGNPIISIEGMTPSPSVINAKLIKNLIMDGDNIEQMTLKSATYSEECSMTNASLFTSSNDSNNSGQVLLYEPRLTLLDNVRKDPLVDGGGGIMNKLGGEKAQCSNVPRTFLNEDDCRLSFQVDACAPLEFIEGKVQLTIDNVKLFFQEAFRYVYAITRLRLDDDYNVESPCEKGTRSRWKKDSSNTCIANLNIQSATIFRKLIEESDDINPHFKDVYIPIDEQCHFDDQDTVEMWVMVGSDCWKTVHPDHLNVYDFSGWTTEHPGGREVIKAFAIDNSHSLMYPSSHTMLRWKNRSKNLPFVGRLGDYIDFKDFPDELRSKRIANIFGLVTPTTVDGKKAVVCGSPYETSSKLFRSSFALSRRPELEVLTQSELTQQKRTVWTMIASEASDQLRQRIAW